MADGGNMDTLHAYWGTGEGAAKIRWGQHGDHERCVRQLMDHGHMTEGQAHGYCNLMEKRVTGRYPAQHAAMTKRSEPMDHDADGLDSSWDADLDDLPDLAGVDVADLESLDPSPAGEGDVTRAAKLGTGARFKALKAKLAAKGASDPGALAAWIGRKRYGRKKFAALASKARAGTVGVSRGMVIRAYPLEDIHIVSRGEGDGSGRVVEAYAAMFDTPTIIRDSQGHYEEVIDRAAFDHTLARISRSRGGFAGAVRVLYNHGKTMEGVPAAEFQRPIAKPLDIRPDARGLLTRSEYKRSPLAEEILDDIKEGRITAQSFEGPDLRSDPPLHGPGDRYRKRGGTFPRVRRMMLGLLNYGPALFAAYDAPFLGVVRMSLPGLPDEEELEYPEDEEFTPDVARGDTGGSPGELHPSRLNAHRLWHNRLQEQMAAAGIVLPGRD